jgi:hypothetical protein
MAGVGRHRPENGKGWSGRERSGLHGPPFSARESALGLDGRGAEPPLFLRKKCRQSLSVALCARDRHRMDETPLPARLRGICGGSVSDANRARSGFAGRVKKE